MYAAAMMLIHEIDLQEIVGVFRPSDEFISQCGKRGVPKYLSPQQNPENEY